MKSQANKIELMKLRFNKHKTLLDKISRKRFVEGNLKSRVFLRVQRRRKSEKVNLFIISNRFILSINFFFMLSNLLSIWVDNILKY